MSIANNMIKEMKKDVKRLLIKSSYPLTGNLSEKVKKGLENVWGNDFNVSGATVASCITNFFVNSSIAYQVYKTNSESAPEAITAAGVITLITYIESIARLLRVEYYKSFPASLAGKIMSFPVEYTINLYEKAKGELKCQ